jgi:uncharacterized protein (TIGR03663 family)
MAKASTKSRNWAGRSASVAPEESRAAELSTRAWRIASLSVLAVGIFLRVYDLTLKPLHHDEGVNSFFLTRLIREGIYQYDPANYHGPSIYYFGLLSTLLFGLNTVALRLVTVAFGVATIWLALCLRKYLGTIGALVAAGLIAISPGAVYLSRYFIHESLVVFFTFGIIVALLKYNEGAPPAEENGTSGLISLLAGAALVASSLAAVYRPQNFRIWLLLIIVSSIVVIQSLWHFDGRRSIYLILAALSAGLLFASKETALVSVTVLGLALVTTSVYLKLRRKGLAKKKRRQYGSGAPVDAGWLSSTIERIGGWQHLGLLLLVFFALFVFVNVLFYSSFFTNAKGVGDSLQTYMIWAKTGKQEHVHPVYQHLVWLIMEESPVLILGVVGAFLAVVRANNRFGLFAAQWAFGLLAAYSLVPYKTPWLLLNFIVPLAVAGGYAVNEFYSWNRGEEKFVWAVMLAAAVIMGYQTFQLNFRHYDDENYVYVYGHTYREFLPMVTEIKRIGQQTNLKEELDIAVLSPDYWPLPWYLREYHRVGYYGQPSPTSSSLVIINTNQEPQVLPNIQDRYTRVDSYPLRPGVVLVLYARKDLNIR